ncbi:MAG TPA: FHA domain-containing protein [Kofleriaceae bacterium]
MFKLVIQDDEGKTTIVPLIRDEITIGRKEGNTIRLTERNVSRRHARILRNNGEVHIEDLGSYNGIRVNNARIAERVSLRVSDQVQIGDYKLYLKAEGIDQVDDSRTTPIERVDAGPTDTMAAVAPLPTAAVVTSVPSVPPMIGNPNRTMVAMADTEPGRSVGPATAAAVAALSAQGGYGKLVVLSSNFAGKEFELSRPQMIIGRTDENDIVINHRSISRNHAKLTREPETGRYTISDLQSSNGVRVNGSDYGKVELRRGDVIDLGHVRLRFVEAGEDFLFARDAVITDVPEAGGRRGMLVAVLAAIVVLAVGVVIYTIRGSGQHNSDSQAPGGGPSGDLVLDGGEPAVADQPLDAAQQMVAVTPPAVDAAVATIDHSPPAGADADKSRQKAAHCQELEANKDWQNLRNCAGELAVMGAKDKGFKDQAEAFRTKSVREAGNEVAASKAQSALRDGNLREAQKQLKTIGPDSVYFATSNDAFRAAETKASEDDRRKAQGMASAHDCAGLKRFQTQVSGSSTQAVAAVVAAVKCVERVAQANPGDPGPVRQPSGSGSDASRNPPPPPPDKNPSSACDTMNVEDLMSQAANQYAAGFFKSALSLVTKVLACKQDVRMYRFAATYACAAHDANSAKAYLVKVPAQFQSAIVQRCQQENITVQP